MRRTSSIIGAATAVCTVFFFAALTETKEVVGGDQSATIAPVARVGERTITRAMLDAAVRQALGSQYFHRDISPQRRAGLEREQLELLVRRDLDLLAGYDRGLELPMDEGWRVQKQQEAAGGEAYLRSIEDSGISREGHARLVAETLLAAEARKQFVIAKAAVSDEEVREAYDADPSRWYRPKEAHVWHILVKVSPGADSDTWVSAEKKARSLCTRIRGGEPFGDVAAAHSDDMYRIKGGDLGWIHRGRLVKPLEDALWSADSGALVGPIKSGEGYHVAMVVDRRERQAMSYLEAAPLLRQRMEQGRLDDLETRWYAELRNRYPVVILDPSLRAENP